MGCCDHGNDMILDYEYVENGSLRSHLYGSDLPNISWAKRLEICIGAARGLLYLHTIAIIHCDVKSTNILLDENFVEKVTHFGLSKIEPDLDHASGGLAVHLSLPAEWINSAECARKWQKREQLERIIDPNLLGRIRLDSLRKFGETTEECLADYSVDRPSMSDVLWNLEYALHLQEVFILQDNPEENCIIPIGEQINKFNHVDASSFAA
ncbi:hypothetical protein CQW23_26083 [Capsicum baccatum]|uniref:Protein kinase domain-containing protein n=1 Tax=Capsicum baccatum TaxID=33114 RepID=A0A2G2VMU2_CAPBA|nr:hypothetical protein CQW23_26083 [Capsicum baccatum]